jgi:hypothetical protein
MMPMLPAAEGEQQRPEVPEESVPEVDSAVLPPQGQDLPAACCP